jgi:hypothetical protein
LQATEVRVVAVTLGDSKEELEGIRRELARLLRRIRIEALVLVLSVMDRMPQGDHAPMAFEDVSRYDRG